MEINKIYPGDALGILKKFPDEMFDCAITSPPYWGLRDYGMKEQIGLEETPDEYVGKLVRIFREIRRTLKDDGTIWVNLGDSYSGSWGNYSGKNRGAGHQRKIENGSKVQNPAYDRSSEWRPPTSKVKGLKSKDLVGIPWLVAFALRADGWYLRQDIIWSKPNPMPESVTDRCTKSHEYIFLLSKSQRYYYDHQSIKTIGLNPADDIRRMNQQREDNKSSPTEKINGLRPRKTWEDRKKEGAPARYEVSSKTPMLNSSVTDGTANKRSVWTVPTSMFRDKTHYAVFPELLVVDMIKAGSRIGGIVLDPFMGAGTTGLVAQKMGRSYVGVELNPEYIKISEKRLSQKPLFVK